MSVTLNVEPNTPAMGWEQFCKIAPPFAVAIDGYVYGAPRFQAAGPRVNFNHHEEVDRLATRATCSQILMAVRHGLCDRFRQADEMHMHVFANDCDQDVCLSWFLLDHSWAVERFGLALDRLVSLEDKLDTTAGAYPFPKDMPALRELAWIFDPYTQFRLSGQIDQRDSEQFKNVIYNVDLRILRHLAGRGQTVPLDTRYEKIGGGPGWAMVREIGAQARTGMFADGVHAFVSVRERPQGGYTYALGRMSIFVPFDIPGHLSVLNQLENNPQDPWGGSNTTAGSPRIGGSKHPPETIEKIINQNQKN